MTGQSVQNSIHYVQNHKVEATQFDDEWVLLNTGDYTATRLNAVGGFCWTLLQEEQSFEAITQALVATFEWSLPADELERSVESFLNELLKYGLILKC